EKVSGEYLNNSSNTSRPMRTLPTDLERRNKCPETMTGTRGAETAREPPHAELTCWLPSPPSPASLRAEDRPRYHRPHRMMSPDRERGRRIANGAARKNTRGAS